MKKLLLLLALVLTAVGLSAQVTVSMQYGNGSLSNNSGTNYNTWTSNANSGVAGLTITSSGYSMATNGTNATSYYYMTPASNTTTYNYTITAPAGYLLTGYSITFKSGRNSTYYYVYGKTSTGVTTSSYTKRATSTAQTMDLTNQSASTLQFSFRNGNSNGSQRVVITAFTITLVALADADVSWSSSSATVDAESSSNVFPTLVNNSGVNVTYSSSNTSIASIASNGTVTLNNPGSTTITASWAEQTVSGTRYRAGSVSYTLNVTGPYDPQLTWKSAGNAITNTYVLNPTAAIPWLDKPEGLVVTYTTSDPDVVTVSSEGVITAVGNGTAVITASSASQTVGGTAYKAATAELSVFVTEADGTANVEVCTGTFFPSFSDWSSESILDVFYDVNKAGRYYPTDADWISHGFNPDDMAFVRSHVRRRARIYADTNDHSVRDQTYWKINRTMFANLPSGLEKNGSNGYPGGSFVDDNFSMWNYVDLFGSWNHSIGHAPGAWTDAAHKNGVNISGGCIFFDSSAGYNSYVNGVRAKDNTEPSGFKYVRAMISMLMYFGQEGVSFNYEYGSAGEADQRAFMTAIYDLAAQRGYLPDCRFNYYTFNSNYNPSPGYEYAEWGTKGDGRVTDIMLNYDMNDFYYRMADAKENYRAEVGDEYADRIYAGVWIVTLSRQYKYLQNNDVGIAIWGEHGVSRFWSYNTGSTPQEVMDNYVELLERGFSGGNRNPNNTPEVVSLGDEDWGTRLAGFHGFASFMTERSTVVGELPFLTNFQLGNGMRYHYKGKKTAGSWNNMANQDIVPTYRWLVVNDASASTKTTNTSIVPRFSYDDAYMGGSMLKITGAGTTAGDIVLYKSELTVSAGNPIAKIAVKTPDGAGATNLQLKLKVDGSWQTYAVGSTEGTTWEEKTIELNNISQGAVIENIVLRMTSISTATNLYVGMLEINDDVKAMPFGIKDLQAKIYNESKTSMSIKAWWDIDKEADQYGHVYNDELNIDHFELLYKPSRNGNITEISRTSQWGAIAANVVVDEFDDPWIGVRSVSTDLKTYSDIVWLNIGHNIDAEGSLYGDGFGYPTLGSFGANMPAGGEADVYRNYMKFKTAYTTGASVQNLDYDISSSAPDPYVGSSNPNCPAFAVVKDESVLIDITAYETADDYCIKAAPGDNVSFYFTHSDLSSQSASISYDLLSVFIDWYGVGSFADDPTFSVGVPERKQDVAPYYQSGLNTASCLRRFDFTVPADAKPQKTRLRLVFSDAWSGQPGAVMAVLKGLAYDFPLEIMDVGQTPGISPSEIGKDQGQAQAPDGTPGAPVSTWGGILDGTAYYLTDYTTSQSPVVLYNDATSLSGVASTGDAQASLKAGSVADNYAARFVARREGKKIMFVNGHGEYLGIADLTEEYSAAQNEGNASDGNLVDGKRLIYVNGRPMILQSAEYPLEVILRPTDAVTINGVTDDPSNVIGIATWSAPFETVVPDGIEVYAISTNNSSEAFIRPVDLVNNDGDRVIPANTGVILITVQEEVPASGLTFQMLPAKSSAASDPQTSLMGAQTAKTYDNDDPTPSIYYVLAVKNGVRKFYKAKSNTGTKLGANKAYLVPENTNASGMSLVFNGAQTSVGRVVFGLDPEAPAYDLQGRRVKKDDVKGVYIQNGKKHVKF